MANGEMEYWVFHRDQLDIALTAHVNARLKQGFERQVALAEGIMIREFLLSPAGASLRGGRAG